MLRLTLGINGMKGDAREIFYLSTRIIDIDTSFADVEVTLFAVTKALSEVNIELALFTLDNF